MHNVSDLDTDDEGEDEAEDRVDVDVAGICGELSQVRSDLKETDEDDVEEDSVE